MSHRSSNDKKLARLRKRLRAPLPAHFSLIHWLEDRRYAQTAGEARAIILAGRVRNGSHTLGIEHVPVLGPTGKQEIVDVVQPILPTKFRDGLIVLDA